MSDALMRPVKLSPRLDAKPWGGRRLANWGIALPSTEPIGEALLTAPEATIASGELAGMTLSDLARSNPKAWIGAEGLRATGGRTIFPLLIKLIDGQADLSIQVHPDDRAAEAAGLGTGKTEAYHVLEAGPGSVLYLGLRPELTADEFERACRRGDGSAAHCLRQIPASAGMTVLIPAGTPHAMGAGIVVYEIQQPSNVTYRLDDWGRVDAAGKPRELHLTDGLGVLDTSSRPEPARALSLPTTGRGRDLLVATQYFALERLAPRVNDVIRLTGVESPQVLTCLEGAVVVDALGWVSELSQGQTMVVPSATKATLSGGDAGVIMRGWVPDLERDVVAPAREGGVSNNDIAGLGVHLGRPSPEIA